MGDSSIDHTSKSIRIQDLGRPAISRQDDNTISILGEVTSGENSHGWSACCAAPSCCSTLGTIPCCFHNPEYITLRHESSKYVYVRENSLEWNDPVVGMIISTKNEFSVVVVVVVVVVAVTVVIVEIE
jgi:hypothetical protein